MTSADTVLSVSYHILLSPCFHRSHQITPPSSRVLLVMTKTFLEDYRDANPKDWMWVRSGLIVDGGY